MNISSDRPTTPDSNPTERSSDRGSSSLLALDLATLTGWALRTADGQILSATVSFKPSRYDGGGIRYLRFRAWLDSMAQNAGGIGAVYHEEIRRHVSTASSHVYGGLLATLTAWCEERGIAYQGVPVGTIKRFIAGKGNADKAAVIAAVRARGFTPTDDNEADALAILLWAMQTQGGVRWHGSASRIAALPRPSSSSTAARASWSRSGSMRTAGP